MKFLGVCFQTYTSVDKDKDPFQRETLLNEISIYLLANAELVAEYFYTTKNNLIANYVHLITFLYKSGRFTKFFSFLISIGRLKTLEKIDKQLLISALVRSQQEILKITPSVSSSKDGATYLEEKEVNNPFSYVKFLLENN